MGVQFRVIVPLELEIDDTAQFRDRRQRPQGRPQYCQLATSIARQPHRESERVLEAAICGALVLAVSSGIIDSDIVLESRRFDLALDQSDGSATHRSNRNQHDRIDSLPLHPLDDGRHGLVQQPFRTESVVDYAESYSDGCANRHALPFMAKHISIRLPWHDRGWDGHVCGRPTANVYCTGEYGLKAHSIRENKKDQEEEAIAGKAPQAVRCEARKWRTSDGQASDFVIDRRRR